MLVLGDLVLVVSSHRGFEKPRGYYHRDASGMPRCSTRQSVTAIMWCIIELNLLFYILYSYIQACICTNNNAAILFRSHRTFRL